MGFAKLDAAIPNGAVVQSNPQLVNPFRVHDDIMEIGHQTAITVTAMVRFRTGGRRFGVFGHGYRIRCPFKGADAQQARATCREFGIQYLVARIYDPAWQDKESWVWKLNPVVANEEFRALDCRK